MQHCSMSVCVCVVLSAHCVFPQVFFLFVFKMLMNLRIDKIRASIYAHIGPAWAWLPNTYGTLSLDSQWTYM